MVTLKSGLEVIQTGTIWKPGCGFLFALHNQRIAWPWKLGWGCLRSLKMTPFDRSYTTFYWSAIVNIALSCTVFELFDVEWYRDLKICVRGNSRSFQRVPFESLGAFSCLPFIVTGFILRHFGHKARYWSKIVIFSYPLHWSPPLGGSRQNSAFPFGTEKLEWWIYPKVKKVWRDDYSFWQNVRTWQTDAQTHTHTHGHRMTAKAARKKNHDSGRTAGYSMTDVMRTTNATDDCAVFRTDGDTSVNLCLSQPAARTTSMKTREHNRIYLPAAVNLKRKWLITEQKFALDQLYY